MADHAAHGEESGHEHGELERVTAPMQKFGVREAGIGFVVFAVGLILTFGLALTLA